MIGAVPQEGDVVNEVGEENVPAVELRRPEVILPPRVWVGSVVEVAAASDRGGRILRLGERVGGLQVQVAMYGPGQRRLKGIVNRIPFVIRQADGAESGIGQG